MVDYGELAERARVLPWAGDSGGDVSQNQLANPAQAYEKVKASVMEEVAKANQELRKRRVGLIERVFSPSYNGRLCLSFGTMLLCTVDYTVYFGACRILAIVTGPPNGAEISRKQFLVVGESPQRERLERLGSILWAKGSAPQQIAVEIVSGLLAGEFA
jgi:hypothetical protein